MLRSAWLVAACAYGLVLTARPGFAKDPPAADPMPATKITGVEQLLAVLDREFQLKEGDNPAEIPLFELLDTLSKRYAVTITVNTEAFKAVGIPNVGEEKPTIAATSLRGLTVHQFLMKILESHGATYLVRNGSLEIVPVQYAARMTKATLEDIAGEEGRLRLSLPLVSAIFKEQKLTEVLGAVAEKYDLTILVSPEAGELRAAPVTARVLNVPADQAVELLALQADLRVVRTGNTFLVTSKGHAAELAVEKRKKMRQEIELEKLRELAGFPAGRP